MKAFIIHTGVKYMGRLLAHDKADALKKAGDFWGQGKKYKAVAVDALDVETSAPAKKVRR